MFTELVILTTIGKLLQTIREKERTMLKIDDIKCPPIIGEIYLVPCFVSENKIYPIINHLHSDKENGQAEQHYHIDFRFECLDKTKEIAANITSRVYPYKIEFKNKKIEYVKMKCRLADQLGSTPVHMIKHSKLKHKCIHKGKCPHRGYDLSQVKAINGKIKCPLHGLEFDENNHQLLNDQRLSYIRIQVPMMLQQLGTDFEFDGMKEQLEKWLNIAKEEYSIWYKIILEDERIRIEYNKFLKKLFNE